MVSFARLQYFRSYRDESFEFEPGVNIIVGPNASGKTTLVEAIMVVLAGKSFKSRDYELIQKGSDWARLDVGMSNDMRVCKLVHEGERTKKIFEITGKEYKRFTNTIRIPTVVFEPNHLLLLHGSPELRRTFLDDLLTQLHPGFDHVLKSYRRVLAQRNALLKQSMPQKTKDQLFVWNLRISELGGKIVHERQKLLTEFSEHMSDIYSDIACHKTTVTMTYETKLSAKNYESSLLHTLEKNTERDHILGFTSAGPHREDISLVINDQPASQVASRGEVRTILLVLKMLEAKFIEAACDTKPVLLLDDVFSELDGKRRQALVNFLKPYQSFITTTDADVVLDHFSQNCHVIPTR